MLVFPFVIQCISMVLLCLQFLLDAAYFQFCLFTLFVKQNQLLVWIMKSLGSSQLHSSGSERTSWFSRPFTTGTFPLICVTSESLYIYIVISIFLTMKHDTPKFGALGYPKIIHHALGYIIFLVWIAYITGPLGSRRETRPTMAAIVSFNTLLLRRQHWFWIMCMSYFCRSPIVLGS